MGVVGAWDAIQPSKVLSLRDWCKEFYEENGRLPSLAVDISNHIYQVSTEKRSQFEGIEHTQLTRRLLAFLSLGCSVICVFDGPLIMEKRRHAASGRVPFLRQQSPMITYTKRLAGVLGLTVVEAKSEAEAQCASLQKDNEVDVVFTSDADVLANGATRILRYDSASSVNSGAASMRIVKYYEVEAHQAPVFAMQALLLGNDWAEGVAGIGAKTARGISESRTGFAARLAEISTTRDDMEITAWREDLSAELRSNKHRWLTKKCNKPLPQSFPNLEVLDILMRPHVHKNVLCASKSTPASDTDSQALKTMITELKALWLQPSPNFGDHYKPLSPAERTEIMEKSLVSFQKAIAPVVVALLLTSSADQIREFTFKYVDSERSVEVVKSPNWNDLQEHHIKPDFLIGARVPRYLVDGKSTVRFIQKLDTKIPENNSTLDQFLGREIPPKAAHTQSSPAVLLSTRLSADVFPSTATTGMLSKIDTRRTKRTRSKFILDDKDTRMERYFKPTRLTRSTIYPYGTRAKATKSIGAADADLVAKHQYRLVDLTENTSVTSSPVDVDDDTDTDDDSISISCVRPASFVQKISGKC